MELDECSRHAEFKQPRDVLNVLLNHPFFSQSTQGVLVGFQFLLESPHPSVVGQSSEEEKRRLVAVDRSF